MAWSYETQRSGRGVGNRLVLAALAVWAVALTAGFVSLWRYKASSSVQDEGPPAQWPLDSSLRHATDRATLVLFAHPRCACTHASVTELARLMARMSGSLAARVSIVRPAGVGAGWDDTELAARAAAIPGATVSVDDGGVEAERFGVRTSGYTVLYDATGRRLFKGGITSARGHEGESFGSKRIISFLTTGAADRADAPTFGCALSDPAAPMEEDTQ